MTAHTHIARRLDWLPCDECKGEGVMWVRHLVDDERPVTCDECDGAGGSEWQCGKCGNGVAADGECVVCDFVGLLPASLPLHANDDFAKAVAELLWQHANGEPE